MTRTEAAALAAAHRAAITRGILHPCEHPGGSDICPCLDQARWEEAIAAIYTLERFVEASDARAS